MHNLTITRSRWGAIANPHSSSFDTQQHKSHHWGITKASQWLICLICFKTYNVFVGNTHKVWYTNLWNLFCNWNLRIFDQDHQVDHRVKSLLAFCFTQHPCQFDMPHYHFWPPGHPLLPHVTTLGHQNKNPIKYVLYLLFVRTLTVLYKKTFELTLLL